MIELKAPKVKIGVKETTQVKSYAFPVQEDERFRGVPARRTFWLVANELDQFARNEVKQGDRPEGVLWQSSDLRSRIWVKRWAQIIHECRVRLKIFQKELNHSADRDASLAYLKKTYARVLQGLDTGDQELDTAEPEAGASESRDAGME